MSLHLPQCNNGQSLVEFALIVPALIFMLIGVFEVGWALRGYLILSNANREAARFAVRNEYLDFNAVDIGYENVWTHTVESISGQIDFNTQNAAMIVSYISVDAPCTMPYTITTPSDIPAHTWKYPVTTTWQSRINYNQLAGELLAYQIKHSCDLITNSFAPVPNNVIIVEMFYQQPQLFGFPIISNPFTDPVPMYAHSIFRKIQDSRK